MLKNSLLLVFSSVLLLASCRNSSDLSSDVLVMVRDKAITAEEVSSQIPKGLSAADSMLRAENIIRKRAIDLLMDEAAYRNIGDDKAEIERLVEEYRLSLIRHRYQERIVKDKMSEEITETDKLAYYEENKALFTLDDNIIKGLFLKVPANAPNLNDLRKWYMSDNTDDLEKIEKYSLQNAVIYDYFYDTWVTFADILTKIPSKLSNPTLFLRYNNNLETSDSSFVYFLHITEKLFAGNPAPYDYVQPQIQNMLLNKRTIEYLQKFKEELYRDAIKNRTVIIKKD